MTSSHVLFEADVVIMLDRSVRINADLVEFDRKTNTVHAQPTAGSWVVIQTEELTMLAREVFIDATKSTMRATELKIHTAQGRIAAAKAERCENGDWLLTSIQFTACQKDYPHWSFAARRGCLHKNYLIKVSGITFSVGVVPVCCFPLAFFSLHATKSSSGFVFPKLYFDKKGTFGIKTEYYMDLGNRTDNTVGLFYRHKRGVIASDEFRWAAAPDELLHVTGKISQEWDSWIERHGKILKGNDTNYLFKADYLQPMTIGSLPVQSIVAVDLGSDKGIEYRFYNELNAVDDTFENWWIMRYHNDRYQLQGGCESDRVRQSRFTPQAGSPGALIETINNVTVTRIAPVDYASTAFPLARQLSYGHNFYGDYCDAYDESKRKRYDAESVLTDVQRLFHMRHSTLRFGYAGRAQTTFSLAGTQISAALLPQLQVRSAIKPEAELVEITYSKRPLHQVFMGAGVEWTLPEIQSDSFFLQPQFSWKYVPQLHQDHWYWMDKRDHVYAANTLASSCRFNWIGDDRFTTLLLSQGFNCGSSVDLFPLEKNPYERHLLPLELRFEQWYSNLFVSSEQLFSWKNSTLLQLITTIGVDYAGFSCALSHLYQHPALQQQAKLFSDVPHFLLVNVHLPLGKNLQAQYEGTYYASINNGFFDFRSVKPLGHGAYLSYRADCWALMFGYEEKRYKRCGNWESEQAFVVSFKLESLGSFAKKFKRPPLISDDEGS